MRLIDADALIHDITKLYCEDCEKRKGIKNGKLKFVYEIGDAPCRACGLDGLKDVIEDAPTVEAERHGHWIRTEAYPHRVVCSECHRTYVRNENIIEGRYKGDEIVPIYCTEAEYCPHCGALMDEVEE